jgi:hypothetical protein
VTERRFPPPWSVEELDACFVARDHNGQALAYVYFEDEPGRRSAAKLLSIGKYEAKNQIETPIKIGQRISANRSVQGRTSARCKAPISTPTQNK